jgi:ribosomal protein S18 acetylase RimI-like enzyme
MTTIEIVDVTDETRFALVPTCADPSFDHRTCDYWENAEHGSKAARAGWLPARGAIAAAEQAPSERSSNPFAPPPKRETNPFAPPPRASANPFESAFSAPPKNPFLYDLDEDPIENPFTPQRAARPAISAEAPRKLQLLGRGLGIFGSYAKLLLADGQALAYCQFGPLSAYPRALRLRELYPQLPDAPLPAVISCVATTADARRSGHALRLVEAVCEDLAGRGFAAVESYPEVHAPENSTPAGAPRFWLSAGFRLAVDDERYPVMRKEL